jgi:hypothetical protein
MHVHKHQCTILELAILLTSEKKFEEFSQALMALLTNAQMVDPKFVINPLSPDSKGKDITSKGEISPNMTKLGVSGSPETATLSTNARFGTQLGTGASHANPTRKKNFKIPRCIFR